MQKKIELAFKIVVGLTFFVPLAFLPKYFIFPFIVPKIIAFRTLALILLGLYIVLLKYDWKKYIIRFSKLNIVVVLFLLSFFVSTFFGIDWYRSFWDNHERMLGLFTVTHYVFYYLIVTSVIKGWTDWKWLLRTFLLAGGIVMGIAAIQQFDNEFLLNTSNSRSSSTLGNSIYVGGYGLFLTFIGWLLVVREKNIYWKYFAGLVGILGFLGIFFSGSRGALLGLLVGIVVLFISYLITLKEHKKIRYFLGVIIVIGVVSLSVLYAYRQTTYVRSIPSVGRLLNTSITNTNTTRMMAWGIAVEGWKDHPIIGWGPGNYYYAFNKYYRAEFLRFGYRETWFDNAHNIVLNTFTERGVFGGVIYLSLFGVAILMLWQAYRKGSFDAHMFSVGSAFLLAHLVQTITVFENPTSYLYFFFFLALINSQILTHSKKDNLEKVSERSQGFPVGISVVSAVAILLMIYSTNINPARANMATLGVLRGVYGTQDISQLYEKATSIPTPHIDDIRSDVARTISPALRNYVKVGKPDLARALFQLAVGELEKNRKLHPLDLRVHAQLSLIIQEVSSLSGDKSLLLEAEKIMEDALTKSPERQQFIYTLAGLKIQLDKHDEARALYKKAIADDEIIGESWWRLALLESVFGELDEAVNIINEAKEKGIIFGAEGDLVIAGILEKTSNILEESL